MTVYERQDMLETGRTSGFAKRVQNERMSNVFVYGTLVCVAMATNGRSLEGVSKLFWKE